MASISRRLALLSRRCPSRTHSPYAAPKYTTQWQTRPLSTTPARRADENNPGPPKEAAIPGAPASDPTKEAISPNVTPQKSTGGSALQQLVEDLKALDPEVIEDAIRKGKEGVSWVNNAETKEMDEDDWFIPEETQDTRKMGFWGEGEPTLGKDEDYYGDDLTSLGHGELEQHRELREYARLIAWELPLLNQLARPFEPPTAATPFRFRYTSYLGESHPATNKVVVEFSSSDLSLTSTQRDKLIKLAGVRYNPDTDIIKMSCESYDTQAQNKRFLGESITNLIKEAKDGKDTFADVPFDFRHHKPKVRHEFPKEWILTPERKQYLENKRKEMLQLDDQKANNGELVDGKNIVANSLPTAIGEPVPVMVGGPRGRAFR
ncbi:37S ribosomal protein S24, mitochondrial [Paraconiothyrium brasiliense]|uniref:37S ribosomal protein S24, mitochondrial n=1 Tax=Paraconiothyrium brasiliense TaxID=300254 RepID=A0ABR3QQZ3_9PLEO